MHAYIDRLDKEIKDWADKSVKAKSLNPSDIETMHHMLKTRKMLKEMEHESGDSMNMRKGML